ncbi:MAG TPA: hypothetical protein VI643_03620 [Planctomycetota bacterium]|nr:hypothetical protein [Planctomycetota bacterium]
MNKALAVLSLLLLAAAAQGCAITEYGPGAIVRADGRKLESWQPAGEPQLRADVLESGRLSVEVVRDEIPIYRAEKVVFEKVAYTRRLPLGNAVMRGLLFGLGVAISRDKRYDPLSRIYAGHIALRSLIIDEHELRPAGSRVVPGEFIEVENMRVSASSERRSRGVSGIAVRLDVQRGDGALRSEEQVTGRDGRVELDLRQAARWANGGAFVVVATAAVPGHDAREFRFTDEDAQRLARTD